MRVFQGVAEAELEKDLERTFKIFFASSTEAVSAHTHICNIYSSVHK